MKETDNELISNVIKDNCNNSFEELVSRHEKLYYKVCQKYAGVITTGGANLDDLLNDRDFIFFKCVNSFNPDKGAKFSTWIGNYARYHCLNFIKSNCKYVKFETERDLENLIELKNTDEADLAAEENKKELKDQIFNILSKLKDKRIHRVYLERYNRGEKKQTWSKIAKKLNISTQTVINLHTRGSKILKYKMESRKLLDFV